ncbi:hypothetical protein Y032_0096g2876 [Ancylostoma ceylanicum]|uniref:Uncharacterized protein n=1 Tax=Ancylostoma ceylanicum TaxID=53326 RepID=A0A016TJW6_9BILA|nr:hypothetical protein Y032_0096g2876 [Ancylostoma ceylanicum]
MHSVATNSLLAFLVYSYTVTIMGHFFQTSHWWGSLSIYVRNVGNYSELQTAVGKWWDRVAGTLVICCTSRGGVKSRHTYRHTTSVFLCVHAQQARYLRAADYQSVCVALLLSVYDRLEFTVSHL